MKKMLSVLRDALMASARARAKQIMDRQAQVAAPSKEAYSANAGGWN
jgi:hypothetical protein